MLLFAGFMVALGFYVAQNPGTFQVDLFYWQFAGIPKWFPAVTAAAATFLLMLLYSSYAGVRTSMRHFRMRRQLGSHESQIVGLRDDNERLRNENQRLRARAEAAGSSARPGPIGLTRDRVRGLFRG